METEKILVKNNKPHIKDWPHPDPKTDALTLMPGLNEIPREMIDWIEKTSPKDASWWLALDTGEIEYVEYQTEEGGKSTGGFDDLTNLKTDDAIEMVRGTHNMDVLRAWQAQESRKGVSKAILDKIAKMTPPPKVKS